ncbi:MAG: dihydroneopterin aldolase [Chloroflexota bacterium]
MSDTILLSGMRFEGIHGVSDEERSLPQLLEVDLEVALDLTAAAASDDLGDTLDYGELVEVCRRGVEEGTQRLLEAVAGAIADEVARRPRVERVTVRVRKPAVPLDVEMDHAQVELTRTVR